MSATKRPLKISGASLFIILPLTLLLTACGPKYSPDTYSSSAVQQASKVESGVVVGVRKVSIRADTSIATTTGAAAGGIAGSQVAEGAVSALSALGGAVVGGIAGSEVGKQVQDTTGYEYIVRNAKGDLLSVTQKDTTPLKIGQRVLLIQGSQARIVNDYTEHVEDDVVAQDGKTDMSKAAQGDSKPPAPAEETETEKLVKAATAAAIAAITAEGMKDSDDEPSTSANSSATEETADTPASAAAVASTEPEVKPTSEEPAAAPTAPTKEAAAPSNVASANPALPQPGEQAVPAPASTVLVPAIEAETKPDTSAAPATSAPAAEPETPDTKSKSKQKAEDKADASSGQASDEDKSELSDGEKADEAATEETTTPPPAKQDAGTAH